MAVGIGGFEEGKELVGADVEDSRAVGNGPPDFAKFLQGGGSSNPGFFARGLGWCLLGSGGTCAGSTTGWPAGRQKFS